MEKIKTYQFSGFLEAGKTTYIQDAIFHDYFYRHGRTLILSFEDGEVRYDTEKLRSFNTDAVYFQGEGSEEITAFCLASIEKYRPDRIYMEDNAMMDDLKAALPPCMALEAKTALIDGTTLALYFNNMRQKMLNIVKDCRLVIFNRVPDKEDLKPYGNAFRIMEQRAAYLWESPAGYHEKAFAGSFAFDTAQDPINIRDCDYASFFLDSLENPDSYVGKEIEIDAQVRLEDAGADTFRVGRMVMTCCLADVQFLSFSCKKEVGIDPSDNSWTHLRARCGTGADEYGRKRLVLEPVSVGATKPPDSLIVGVRSPAGTAPSV